MAALTTYHDEAEDRAVFGTPRSIDFEAWAKQIEKQSSHLAAEIGAYVQAARRAGIEDGVVQQQLMLAHVPHFMINDALKGDDDE